MDALTPFTDDNLTTKQAAAWLGRSPDTLRRWRSGTIGPQHFTIGGRVYYAVTDLRAWIAEQREASRRAA